MQRRIPHQCLRQISTKSRNSNHTESTPDTIVATLRSRNSYKKAYAARKKAKDEALKAVMACKEDEYQFKRYQSEIDELKKTARRIRHEDWELGPLAPKRDVGLKAGVKFGSANAMMVQIPDMEDTLKQRRLAESRKMRKGEKMGRVYKLHDRVVVIKGRFKGQIGSVIRVREGAQLLDLEGINVVEYTVPDFISRVEQDDAPYRVSESPIPMDDVRLVHTVLDPDTHETKEVIVDTMILRKRLVPTDKEGAVARIPPRTTYPVVDESGSKVGEVTTEEKAKKWEGYQVQEYRVIPIYETEILEVKKPKEDAEKPFFDVDTLLITVEEETRVSFPLIAAPMPLSVIDELRSKYSRFRDRHDDEWIQGKLDTVRAKETMLQERRRMMRTPLQELRERQKQLKEEHLALKELDDAALLKIGEAMASKFGSEQLLSRMQAAEEREERAKL